MRLLHSFFSNLESTLTIIYFLCALVDILPILLIYCWSVKNSRNTVLLLKEKTKSSNWFRADLSIHTTTKVLLVCKCSVHSVYSTPAKGSKFKVKNVSSCTTNTWKIFDHRSLLQNIYLISAKPNFHRPLVFSTTHQRSVEVQFVQISKKKFAGVVYSQKSLMC